MSYLDYKDALDAAKALKSVSEHAGSMSCLDYRDALDAENELRLALEHNTIEDIISILLDEN